MLELSNKELEEKLRQRAAEVSAQIKALNAELMLIAKEKKELTYAQKGVIERRIDRVEKLGSDFEITLINRETEVGEAKIMKMRGEIQGANAELKSSLIRINSRYNWKRLSQEIERLG